MLDVLYGQVMRLRRRRVERRPERQRRLIRPVISVGNLSVGGTGKTPVVAAIAQRLIDAGQRPSILSRGYARADAPDGVVVVSNGDQILASVERAGDEPMMVARQVPRATVCVSPDRHLAGTLAERQLGCTVHILDDGFQHLDLARNLDVLVTTIGEITGGRVMPMGRLREPMDAAARAHFLVVSDATVGAASSEAWTLGISQSCGSLRSLGGPVSLSGGLKPAATSHILAVVGIAHPDRFATMLRDASWNVVGVMAFPDHHRYTAADVAAIESKRKAAGADVVFTTDKDAVRLEGLSLPFDAFRVPLVIEFDPPDALMASVLAVLQ
ncbi:MAG TPA: tetraacyldisaccharide 4'-kinase [Vicinamibacterales bacterium]